MLPPGDSLGTIQSDNAQCFEGSGCDAFEFVTTGPVGTLYEIAKPDGFGWQSPQLVNLSASGEGDAGLQCVSFGNCVAYAVDVAGVTSSVTLATETAGTWSAPTPLQLSRSLDSDRIIYFQVFCNSLSECVGGGVAGGGKHQEAVLAQMTNGVWGDAFVVPGITRLHRDELWSQVTGFSCPSAGNCLATGIFDLPDKWV